MPGAVLGARVCNEQASCYKTDVQRSNILGEGMVMRPERLGGGSGGEGVSETRPESIAHAGLGEHRGAQRRGQGRLTGRHTPCFNASSH